MIPKVIPTSLNSTGATTIKTNRPRRIMPTILKTFFASFIAYLRLPLCPQFIGLIVRSQVYEVFSGVVPLKISHILVDKTPKFGYEPTGIDGSPVSIFSAIIIHTFLRYGCLGIEKPV